MKVVVLNFFKNSSLTKHPLIEPKQIKHQKRKNLV